MRGGFLSIIFLVVVGVMLADIISNSAGTKVVFDGLSSLWQTSVNGLLAKPSSS